MNTVHTYVFIYVYTYCFFHAICKYIYIYIILVVEGEGGSWVSVFCWLGGGLVGYVADILYYQVI